jgi:2-polyprenyl-6-methoxyphenol hydroxylase-like FAD-dependent oxidoreductase
MNFDYDVGIIGGAFSGAATTLMLRRKPVRCTRSDHPEDSRIRS